MKTILSIAAATAITFALPMAAHTQSHKMKEGMHGGHGGHGHHATQMKGGVKIEAAWARATPGKAKNGGAYVTIVNAGKHADRLLGAKADVSKRVEVHTHLMDNGVMRMRKVAGIDLPAGGKIHMKPGGYHVMFLGLHKPLKKGESFPVTLVFEKAGEVKTEVKVRGVGAMGHGAHGGHGGHGHHGSHGSHKGH